MNILVVFTYNYSLLDWQKTGNLEKELSIYKKLHELHGVNFFFLTYGDQSDLKIKIDCEGIKIIPIFHFIKKFSSKKLNFLYSFLYPFMIKNQLPNVDLIKQNQLLGSWISIILKYLLKVKLFVRTGYDMYLFSREITSKYKSSLYYFLTSITVKFADLYSVTSKSDLKFFDEKFPNANVTYRPNWVLNEEYKDIKSRFNNRLLVVGRLEYQKNISFIISCLKNSHFILDVVGSGSEKDNLVLLAKENNVKVNFLGNLDNKELERIYKKYIFYLSSSLFEGNPKTVLEAMSNGCIVFLSDIKNHTELVKDGVNGFIFNFTMRDLTNKIDKILDNQPKLNKISIKAFETVKRNNSFSKLANMELQDYLLLKN
jgi:glycosyltransferase involved in cell wall biosynthesis